MIRSLADIIGAGKLAEWARIRTKHEIPSTADGLCRIILDTTPVVELQFKFQYRSLDVFIDGRKVSNAYFASFGDQIQELLESPDN